MMRRGLMIALAGLLFTSASPPTAQAIIQFQKEFLRFYGVDKDAEEKSEFAQAALEAKCYICHQGKKKKHHNPYGEHLHDRLDRQEDKKNTEKITAALEQVDKLPSNPDDPRSPTFGDLIRAGKLPGGTLEEAKQEPALASPAEPAPCCPRCGRPCQHPCNCPCCPLSHSDTPPGSENTPEAANQAAAIEKPAEI